MEVENLVHKLLYFLCEKHELLARGAGVHGEMTEFGHRLEHDTHLETIPVECDLEQHLN